jgi:hypothetical protein
MSRRLGAGTAHRCVWGAATALALTAYASIAGAQAGDTAAAESLFQTGKSLLEQKNYADACPKLAESYRLDPGTGTLLALALCYEGEGRLASAWGEFADVAARSRREARPDREALARQRMSALESRLPMLTISVAPGAEKIEQLEIKRDGVVVGSGSWATAVPVDPGHHHVEANAPGYKPFATTVTLDTDAARESVTVPVLEHAADLPENPRSEAQNSSWSTLRYAGLGVGVLGVAGLGVGAVFGLRAISLNNSSSSGCVQSSCDPAGFSSRQDARQAGDISTVAFVAGGALVAGGATMFLLGKPRSTGGLALQAVPLLSGRAIGLRFAGAFQ